LERVTKENGEIIKQMDMENIFGQQVIDMLEIGLNSWSMDMEQTFSKMVINIRVNIDMVNLVVRENTFGFLELYMKETLKMVKSKEKVVGRKSKLWKMKPLVKKLKL